MVGTLSIADASASGQQMQALIAGKHLQAVAAQGKVRLPRPSSWQRRKAAKLKLWQASHPGTL